MLPTIKEMFTQTDDSLDLAYRSLGNAADWVRSDWRHGGSLTDTQARARLAVFEEVQHAKDAINRAKGAITAALGADRAASTTTRVPLDEVT